MDNHSRSVPVLAVKCYLYQYEVANEARHSPHPADKICDRWPTGTGEGHPLLGCRFAWFRCQSDAERPDGIFGYVPACRGRARDCGSTPLDRTGGSPCRWPAHKRRRSLLPGSMAAIPPKRRKQTRRRLVVDRIDDLIETFIREHVVQISSHKQVTNLLRRDITPHWGTKSIHSRSRSETSVTS